MTITPIDDFAGARTVVTGAASGIGRACATELATRGATVLALDIDSVVLEAPTDVVTTRWVGAQCDVTDASAVEDAVAAFAGRYGAVTHLVSNAGAFFAGTPIDILDLETWDRSLRLNLTSHVLVLQSFLRHVIDDRTAAIVVIGTRNVAAPGAGAAAYSVPKAGLAQLVRIAALELGSRGIRINVINPDAVFDTGIWTPATLEQSAGRYGLTVEEYRSQSVLGVEVRSRDVAEAVCAVLGPTFSRTTGAQIPVDGGHLRII